VSRGRVILVGAGPGAPDLLTLRGAEALRRADAVVYDALVAPELLDLAPEGALRIDVGKRGHDEPTRPQPETTALLIRLAFEGRTVVRLKGGDPYVFGRGGEEATACAEAGIPFEVVPGVSSVSGALAYAGIPVTDRRHSASFAVVTGHKDPTRVSERTRWDLLANAADTLVVLMGMRNLEEITARLIAAGRPAATPAAVVMNGTLPSQRVVRAPLGELAARAREAGLRAPAVVVVGDVVSLRAALAWYERQPLFGRRVLVTRSAGQARELSAALASAGAQPVVVPLLRLAPAADPRPLDEALGRLAGFDAIVFTSANAVRFTADRARERGVDLAGARAVFCVGPRTAAAAATAGLAPQPLPEGGFDAAGVLEAIRRALPPRGRRFLIPRSELARDALPDGLRADGAQVDAVVAYRNLPADPDAEELRDELRRDALDVLTFASPSAVRRLCELLDAEALAAARRAWIAAIGPHTADALRSAGLPPDLTSPQPDARAFVAAIADLVAGDPDAGSGSVS
jgi:uroporphyrinogen III methyltransferase/synthase